jgi:TPR repeat protein
MIQDKTQALKWYRLAAEQGDAKAQNNLGTMYAKGDCVAKDIVEAYKWFALSAARGNSYAVDNLDKVTWHLSSGQLAQAKKLVESVTPKT